MKLRLISFSLAAHRNLRSGPSRQIWHFQRSQGYAQDAGASRDHRDGPVRRPPHPRQRNLRHTVAAPASEFGVDPDTALQTAIMNLKITKPQDAPLPDRYDESTMPPNVAAVCNRLGLSYPKVKGAYNDRDIALNFSISRKHCIHDYQMRDILDPLSPFQDWALDIQIRRHEKESLWLNVLPLHLKHISAVVQTRGAKRMKHAFAEALNRKGYDRYGRPLGEKEAKKLGVVQASTALYGTVRVRIFDLKKFCAIPYAKVVEGLERQIEQKLRIELGLGGSSRTHEGSIVRRTGSRDEARGYDRGRERYGQAHKANNERSKRDSGMRSRLPRPEHLESPPQRPRRTFI